MVKNPWGNTNRTQPLSMYAEGQQISQKNRDPKEEKGKRVQKTQERKKRETTIRMEMEVKHPFLEYMAKQLEVTMKCARSSQLCFRETPKAAQSRYGGREKDDRRAGGEGVAFLSCHAPVWAQTGHHGANHVSRQPANTIVAHANVVHVSVGDACPVAADTAGIAARVTVLEPGWGCKVQTRERAGFPQGVTRKSRLATD
jgi:hypothetical protein